MFFFFFLFFWPEPTTGRGRIYCPTHPSHHHRALLYRDIQKRASFYSFSSFFSQIGGTQRVVAVVGAHLLRGGIGVIQGATMQRLFGRKHFFFKVSTITCPRTLEDGFCTQKVARGLMNFKGIDADFFFVKNLLQPIHRKIENRKQRKKSNTFSCVHICLLNKTKEKK